MSDDAENKDQGSDEKSGDTWLEQLNISTGKKKFWSSDKFLSLLAFLISIGTFFTFAYQTYLIQKQQYASVLPYLSIRYDVGSEYFRIDVANNGVGPAIIQDFMVIYGDSIYTSTNQLVYGMIKPDSSGNYAISSFDLSAGYALPSKQTITILSSRSTQMADSLKTLFLSGSAKIEIVYSSVFKEKWRITTDSYAPESVD